MKSIKYVPFGRKLQLLSGLKITTPKAEWNKVEPPRFLYHLTHKTAAEGEVDLKRFNIAQEGLWGIEVGSRGVWANTQCQKVNKMWPLPIDGYECSGDWGDFVESSYDVWRIDTTLIKNEWYIDPAMDDIECNAYKIVASDYMYTENSIPPIALRLFKFVSFFDENNNYDFHLSPVIEVNKYIKNRSMVSGRVRERFLLSLK